MVLEINSFDKLMGYEFLGRRIKSVSEKDHFNQPTYVFEFDSIKRTKPKPERMTFCWESAFRIHLIRIPRNGNYELFVMGLHGVTIQYLNYSDVKDFHTFYNNFVECIIRSKNYWDESELSYAKM